MSKAVNVLLSNLSNSKVIKYKSFKKVEARKSKYAGFGLFATQDINKGEVIFFARGELIYAPPDGTEEDAATYPNSIGIDKTHWLQPDDNNPLRFLNHSCEPNVGIKGAKTFCAIRNIKEGEEFLLDYSITECDPDWTLDLRLKCKCGTKSCRGIIKSILFLPKKIYNKYLPYIPTEFQKEYSKKHQS